MKKLAFLLFIVFFYSIGFAQSTYLSLESFGAKADGVVLNDGNMTAGSTVLTSQTASFTQLNINKTIYVAGAAANGGTLTATIVMVNSSSKITLSVAAVASVNNAGVTYGTDCTSAFENWNKAARILRDKTVILSMQKGTYLTLYDNWLAGIKNIIVKGNGCNVICTHGAADPLGAKGSNEALIMPSCFSNLDNNYSSYKYMSDNSYGSKIQTTPAGKDYIKTLNAADVSGFSPGNWVLIYGLHHEDLGGFPPDPRFFEYAKVASVNATSGIIYLDRNTKNFYDAGWPDGAAKSGIGAPRVLSLNRNNFNVIENLVINDINFLPFNGWTGKTATNIRNGRLQIYGYINATINKVASNGAYLGQGEKLLFEGGTIKSQCEPDKVIDSLIIENSLINDFAGNGTINYMALLGNHFIGPFTISPISIYIANNVFDGTHGATSPSMATVGFNKGTQFIQIGPNTWNCNDAKKNTLFSEPGSSKLTVDNVINTNTITVTDNDYISAKNSRQVVPHAVGYSAAGNKLEVTRVYRYNSGNIAVSGNFSMPPSPGEVFTFSFAPNINITSKQIITGPFAANVAEFKSHTMVYKLNSVNKD